MCDRAILDLFLKRDERAITLCQTQYGTQCVEIALRRRSTLSRWIRGRSTGISRSSGTSSPLSPPPRREISNSPPIPNNFPKPP